MCVKQGRPRVGTASKIEPLVLDRIKYYKGLYEYWGASSIYYELLHKDNYHKENLPSISTINRYLKKNNLVHKYERRHYLSPNHPPSEAKEAHECWQIDDMGAEYHSGLGHVILMNIKDAKSSTYIGSFGKQVEHAKQHLFATDYMDLLRKAFVKWGMPKRIQADHGNLFYENNSKSPFPTALHLWLLSLGIELTWSRIYRPTDQAKVERAHRTLHQQIKRSVPYESINEFNNDLSDRIDALNSYVPCTSFKKPPLDAFPNAMHSGREYRLEEEKKIFSRLSIGDYLKKQVWYRKVGGNRTISLGGQVYYIKNATPKSELTITLDPDCFHLIFHKDKELFFKMPIKGLDFESIAKNQT